jgi:putative phosphoesterase
MKLAFLGDVHANPAALQAVLARLRDADRIYSTGDWVGYYAGVNTVLDLLRDRGIASVRGNHDDAAARRGVLRENPVVEASSRYTARVLREGHRRRLDRLPLEWREEVGGWRLRILHGGPTDPLGQYVFPPGRGLRGVSTRDQDLLVLGHTHIPMDLEVRGVRVLNPGSAGQPRDGDPRASCGVFDTRTGQFEVRRVAYGIDGAIQGTLRAGLHPLLADRLRMGGRGEVRPLRRGQVPEVREVARVLQKAPHRVHMFRAGLLLEDRRFPEACAFSWWEGDRVALHTKPFRYDWDGRAPTGPPREARLRTVRRGHGWAIAGELPAGEGGEVVARELARCLKEWVRLRRSRGVSSGTTRRGG